MTASFTAGAVSKSISATHMGSSFSPTSHFSESVSLRSIGVLKSYFIAVPLLFFSERLPLEGKLPRQAVMRCAAACNCSALPCIKLHNGFENLYLNLLYFHCAANGSPSQQKLSPPTPTPVVKASPRCHHRRFPSFPGRSSPAGL